MKNRTWALLRELGFLPLNSRDEFTIIRDFIDKQEFDQKYLREELELAEHSLSQRYDSGCEFPEVIITNYDPGEQEKAEPHQLHLLDLDSEDEDGIKYQIAEPTGSDCARRRVQENNRSETEALSESESEES